MMGNIFKSDVEMPPEANPMIVRTAQIPAQTPSTRMPLSRKPELTEFDHDVVHPQRPRRGHAY